MKLKKYAIKNFYLTVKGPIEAKNEEAASEQITNLILNGEFEFDVEEVEIVSRKYNVNPNKRKEKNV